VIDSSDYSVVAAIKVGIALPCFGFGRGLQLCQRSALAQVQLKPITEKLPSNSRSFWRHM
jgi:hypothetical protein